MASHSTPVKRQRMADDVESNEKELEQHSNCHLKSFGSDTNWKIFNDSIHGHIEIHEACVAVIDTPQFQRLRFIKQLGFSYYVFPGGSCNRFEHSIGVCHLAGQMVKSLRSRQPSLGISDKDILCVELAGLCHDLGHGPHSHLFDGKFIPVVRGNMDWKHEKGSLDMLDYLLEDNGFLEQDGKTLRRDSILGKYGLDNTDIVFIKELIYGPLGIRNKEADMNHWPYEGRTEEKAFLYEIVSNKRTGIDVDKWDYFARDCHHLGIVNNFDHNRFIKFARVLKVNGRLQICARDKEIGNLYQMFYTRYVLHRSAYQHKVSCACEMMAVDALLDANDFLKYPGKDGRMLKLSDCIHDMHAFSLLTDEVLWRIYSSQDAPGSKLSSAKNIIKRIFSRDLYRCLDERSVSKKLQEKLDEKKVGLLEMLRVEMIGLSAHLSETSLKTSDFILQIVYMDFGMKDRDPLLEMRYYAKAQPDTPIKGSTAGLLTPPRFVDNRIRVYSRVSDDDVCRCIQNSFNELCDAWEIQPQQNEQGWEPIACTPEKKPSPLVAEYSAGKFRAYSSQD